MSSIMKRSLQMVPDSTARTMMSSRDISTSLSPHIAGDVSDWKMLTFILDADTAFLTKHLSIPPMQAQDYPVLEEFVRKLDGHPLNIVTMASRDYQRFHIPAYSYNLFHHISHSRAGQPKFDVSFPDFTVGILAMGCNLLNLPLSLRRLALSESYIREDQVQNIANLKNLEDLTIVNLYSPTVLNLKGLPKRLTFLELMIQNFNAEIAGEADDYFGYNCPHLKKLALHMPRGLESVPEWLQMIFGETVTDLWVKSDDSSYDFTPALKHFRTLQKLQCAFASLDISYLPSTLQSLHFQDTECRMSKEVPLLPALKFLEMRMFNVEVLRTILQKALKLEELDDSYYSNYDKIDGVFPSVKILRVIRHDGIFPELNDLRVKFPNLMKCNLKHYTGRMEEFSNIPERSLRIAITGLARDEIHSYEGARFGKFTFDHSKTPIVAQFTAKLPLDTKIVEFIPYAGGLRTHVISEIVERCGFSKKVNALSLEIGKDATFIVFDFESSLPYKQMIHQTR